MRVSISTDYHHLSETSLVINTGWQKKTGYRTLLVKNCATTSLPRNMLNAD